MENLLKKKLLAGQKGVGTFFEIGGANAVECLSVTGLDFLIIDSEHGTFGPESTADLVRTACLRNITPFVRVQDGSRSSVLKMLDIGVQGLIVPCVNTVEEVHNLVEYAKYFPVGNRGVMWGRDAIWGEADYANHGLDDYFKTCNSETLLIPQCETAGCLANIEEIASIEGVDGIFVGPFDLSVALGAPGKFNTREFSDSIDRILKACKAAGKFTMIFTGDAAGTKNYFEKGFDAAAVSLDTKLYINAFRSLVHDIKEV